MTPCSTGIVFMEHFQLIFCTVALWIRVCKLFWLYLQAGFFWCGLFALVASLFFFLSLSVSSSPFLALASTLSSLFPCLYHCISSCPSVCPSVFMIIRLPISLSRTLSACLPVFFCCCCFVGLFSFLLLPKQLFLLSFFQGLCHRQITQLK